MSRNKEGFDMAIDFYKAEIDNLNSKLKTLTQELKETKQCLLASNIRKPVFSPGRYRDDNG